MSVRTASHAGSWYPRSRNSLQGQLDSFIASTEATRHAIKGCRVIISPHAGYSYSGPTAAFGFKALDWTAIKRVFILGPSHHIYLKGCALSECDTYETPLGDLELDRDTIDELHKTGKFDRMTIDVDEDEHSIEMQLPYLRALIPADQSISLIPVLVGNLDHKAEEEYGAILSPYLLDQSNLFVISSDFCHWGSRFSYTYYHAPPAAPIKSIGRSSISAEQPIWKSIEQLDQEGMNLIKAGSHQKFSEYLQRTKNTICGRHPIGVMLAALEHTQVTAKFDFLDYRQSNQVIKTSDSSVSYASGFCCP